MPAEKLPRPAVGRCDRELNRWSPEFDPRELTTRHVEYPVRLKSFQNIVVTSHRTSPLLKHRHVGDASRGAVIRLGS